MDAKDIESRFILIYILMDWFLHVPFLWIDFYQRRKYFIFIPNLMSLNILRSLLIKTHAGIYIKPLVVTLLNHIFGVSMIQHLVQHLILKMH